MLGLQDEVLAIFLQFSKSTLFLVASHLKQEDIHIGHSPEDVGDLPGVVEEDGNFFDGVLENVGAVFGRLNSQEFLLIQDWWILVA